jgi:transposase
MTMTQPTLLPIGDALPSAQVPEIPAAPRYQQADRRQMRFQVVDLDQLVAADHRVREVWEFVEGLNLAALYAEIRAVEGRPGRPPIDPKILLALWVFATTEGVGSARALAEFCESHAAYQWLCGGVSVNYHTLSDFRVDHEAILGDLLTQSVAALMSQGVVALNQVAQDGMRVRAGAGAASFHREKTLQECLEAAEAQVERLRRELEENPGATKSREQAAQERAARERKERTEEALRQMSEIQEKKRQRVQQENEDSDQGQGSNENPDQKQDNKEKQGKRKEVRVSTTDADARVMKMADGGYRPGFNVELATETGTQVIVGVDVTNSGGDYGQMVPMVDQIKERYERLPGEMLVDGGFAKKEDIEALASRNVTVYAPVQEPKTKARSPYEPRAGDSAAVGAWRVRMGTPEGQAIYRQRAATAECANAAARNRGLYQFTVRGLRKVRAVALLFALAHNCMRTAALVG